MVSCQFVISCLTIQHCPHVVFWCIAVVCHRSKDAHYIILCDVMLLVLKQSPKIITTILIVVLII